MSKCIFITAMKFANHFLYQPFTTKSQNFKNLKKKPLLTSIFSFFHKVFYPPQNKFQFLWHFYFIICICFQYRQINFFLSKCYYPAFSPIPTMFSNAEFFMIIKMVLVQQRISCTLIVFFQRQ